MINLNVNDLIYDHNNRNTYFNTLMKINPYESLFRYNENFDHFENKNYLHP